MKDYTKIKEEIKRVGQIKTKDILNMGFTNNDIKIFVEKRIIARITRGTYVLDINAIDPVIPSLMEEEKEQQAELPKAEVDSEPITQPEQIIEKQEVPKTEPIKVEEIPFNPERNLFNRGNKYILRGELQKAEECFKELQNINCHNVYGYFGLFTIEAFKNNFEQAYLQLKNSFSYSENGRRNTKLSDVYIYLLSKLTSVPEQTIERLKSRCINRYDSLIEQLRDLVINDKFEEALKYINNLIEESKKTNTIHMSNLLIKHLLEEILILDFEFDENTDFTIDEFDHEEEIMLPPVDLDELAKRSILIECINKKDYGKAIEYLEVEGVTDPIKVLKQLIEKLSKRELLTTSKAPMKVTSQTQVRIINNHNNELYSNLLQRTTTEPPRKQTSQKANQETPKEKSNDTYLCYQENIRMAKFNEASLKLANYEHQLNSSNNQRNLKYLHDRIEFYKKEYQQNPDQYAQKQSLIVDIYESLAKNEYDRCLELIENYLNLSSLRNPEILSIKAYILVNLNRYEEAEKIVDHLMSEEPRYYYVKALINFKHQRYDACLRNGVKYNERRPRENVTIYTLMAESYRKEKHNKRAIKCQETATKLQSEKEIPLLEYIVEPINLKPDQELSKQLKKFNN